MDPSGNSPAPAPIAPPPIARPPDLPGAPTSAAPATAPPASTEPPPAPADFSAHNVSLQENVRNFMVLQERKLEARLHEAFNTFRAKLPILKEDATQEAVDEAVSTMGVRAGALGQELSVELVWSKEMREAERQLEEAIQTITGTKPHEGPVRAQHCIRQALLALKRR